MPTGTPGFVRAVISQLAVAAGSHKLKGVYDPGSVTPGMDIRIPGWPVLESVMMLSVEVNGCGYLGSTMKPLNMSPSAISLLLFFVTARAV